VITVATVTSVHVTPRGTTVLIIAGEGAVVLFSAVAEVVGPLVVDADADGSAEALREGESLWGWLLATKLLDVLVRLARLLTSHICRRACVDERLAELLDETLG